MSWHHTTCEPVRAEAAAILASDTGRMLGLEVRVLSHDPDGVTLDAECGLKPCRYLWEEGYRSHGYARLAASRLERRGALACTCSATRLRIVR